MSSLIIDRFEGEYAILFIAGSDESLSVSRDALPEVVDEGDYLRIEFEDGLPPGSGCGIYASIIAHSASLRSLG